MRRRSGDYLFSEYSVHDVLRHQERKLYEEIDELPDTQLMNTGLEDWCQYFEEKFRIGVPVIDEGGIETGDEEADVDVSQDHSRAIFDRDRPVYIKGSTVKFFIPFAGDAAMFACTPSQYTFNPPRGEVDDDTQQLVVSFTRLDENAEALKGEFQQTLATIRQNLDQLCQDVAAFNATLRDKARSRLTARHGKRLQAKQMAASLGFPMRRREGAPATFVVPSVRRRVLPTRPVARAGAAPEPALAMEEYEHILSVVRSMLHVIERSPAAFQTMGEEDLRQHFLVQLNGHYEGQATGETFNFEGKTDILIRCEGRNIFIGECKFWKGPASLTGAIDQLLGYASWRDTKTALLIFNRTKSLSGVAAQVPGVVRAHPNFVSDLGQTSETDWRFTLHHRDDPERQLLLTVLLFEVPA